MLLSIVVPIYNVEMYIAKCLQSAIHNGMDSDDFEIIVIDDESRDNSVAIVEEFKNVHTTIKLFSQKNKGLGGARNTGIDNASGNYILFLDSDDLLLPNTIKQIICMAIENDLDILEFGAQGIDEKNRIVYKRTNSTENVVYSGVDYYKKIRYMDSACNKLYKRSFLAENKLRFLEKLYIEDYEFNTRVFLTAKKVMASDVIVSSFLQSPNSITRNIDPLKREKMKNDIIFVMNLIKDQKKSNSDSASIDFLNERLGFLNSTLFYQLFKNKSSYDDFLKLKRMMILKGLYCVDYFIHDRKKNIFRILILRNFYLLKIMTLLR